MELKYEFNLATIIKVAPDYESPSNIRGIEIQHHIETDALVITTSKRDHGEWSSTAIILLPDEYKALADFFHWKESLQEVDC